MDLPLMQRIPLASVAHGRSGDKGNHANIAVIAYTAAGYTWLCEYLTIEKVRIALEGSWGLGLLPNVRIVRYEAPNLLALNFVIYNALDGGASRSLRVDTQGKTLALRLLAFQIEVPEEHECMLRPRERRAR
jgi:hypothetical protein